MSATVGPRRLARDVGMTAAMGGLVAALTPIWVVHTTANRIGSVRRRGRCTELPRASATATDLTAVLTRPGPVVVEGLADLLGLTGAATPDDLVELAGDDRIGVDLHDAAAPYFLYSGGYGAERIEHRTMTVSEFVELMFGEGLAPDVVVYRLFGAGAIDGKIGEVLDRFDRALTAHGAARTEPRFSGLWVGSTGVVTPLHHDAWPGILFQTHGRKRVAMYAPRDRVNLSFRAPWRGDGRWSELPGRTADADPDDFPRLAKATRWETVLEAGDALFIPPYWAHEMEAIEPNISVPFRFATPWHDYLDPGFLRPASEVLRRRIGALATRQ